MIRLLLAVSSLEPRLSTGNYHSFATTISTPQGDSHSQVLFTSKRHTSDRVSRHAHQPTPPYNTDFVNCSGYIIDEIELGRVVANGEWVEY